MADESNRDEQLRTRFSRLRERVRGALRSTPAAAVDQGKNSDPAAKQATPQQQEQVIPEQPRFEELTRERMDAMRDFAWTGKARLEYQAFERQKVNDRERHKQALIRQEVRKSYASKKLNAAADNRADADMRLAKRIPTDEIDNRPGEKFALRRTKGMARKKDPNDTAGSSP